MLGIVKNVCNKTLVFQPPILMKVVGNSLNKVLLGISLNVQICAEESCLSPLSCLYCEALSRRLHKAPSGAYHIPWGICEGPWSSYARSFRDALEDLRSPLWSPKSGLLEAPCWEALQNKVIIIITIIILTQLYKQSHWDIFLYQLLIYPPFWDAGERSFLPLGNLFSFFIWYC